MALFPPLCGPGWEDLGITPQLATQEQPLQAPSCRDRREPTAPPTTAQLLRFHSGLQLTGQR